MCTGVTAWKSVARGISKRRESRIRREMRAEKGKKRKWSGDRMLSQARMMIELEEHCGVGKTKN